jgi:chemotaxis protein methyltransferase CheR
MTAAKKLILPEPMNSASARGQIGHEAFTKLADMVYAQTGIRISVAKRQFVESRLLRRLSQTGDPSFDEYVRRLESRGQDEFRQLIEALTTHKTEWIREKTHFDFLMNRIVPEARPSASAPLMIWSAACSTGEEVYSLSGVLQLGNVAPSGFRILGTDISDAVVRQSEAGLYPIDGEHAPPRNFEVAGLVKKVQIEGKAAYQVQPSLRENIKFRQINLKAIQLPSQLMFHVIFVRNVFIYFDDESRRVAVSGLIRHLHLGGHLILGLSESIPAEPFGLRNLGSSVYQLVAR